MINNNKNSFLFKYFLFNLASLCFFTTLFYISFYKVLIGSIILIGTLIFLSLKKPNSLISSLLNYGSIFLNLGTSLILFYNTYSFWKDFSMIFFSIEFINAFYKLKYKKYLDEEEEKQKFYESIYNVSSVLASSVNPDINSLLKTIGMLTGFDRITIFKFKNDTLRVRNYYDSFNTILSNIIIPFNKEDYHCFLNEQKVYLYDSDGKHKIVSFLKTNVTKNFFIYIPIYTKEGDFYGFFLCESIKYTHRFHYDTYKILKNISYSFSSYIGRLHAEQIAENSAKLSALGEISAGIAHEINNPLAIIHGQSNILKMLIESAKEDISTLDLEEIENNNNLLLETIDRTYKIVNGLRYFTRNDDSNPFVETTLTSIFDTVQVLSINQCKKNGILVTVNKDKIPNDLKIECKSTQIAQVLMNLITNSRDAISVLKEKWIKIECELINNEKIKISVIDSGNGIPKDIGDKILQKFYTTKKYTESSGTGLGLNLAKRIAEAHNGSLSIDYSHQNTKFDLILPLKLNKQETFDKAAS